MTSDHSDFSTRPLTDEAMKSKPAVDGSAPWWRGQEDIVISGISVRMPQSENMAEFADQLMNGVDMVTEDATRWPPGLHGLPKRHAKIKHYEKMDAAFFGITPKEATVMDPQLRILLEVAYEAILDSGYNPQSLGRRVGCFVASQMSEIGLSTMQDPDTIVGYALTGSFRAMFSSRLSYAFNFQGPSFAVDAACSSSLLALQLALDSIRKGECDSALVAGTNMTMDPTTTLLLHCLSVMSMQGKCQAFDANGDGYVRAEGIGALVLQRASAARRIYGTLVHAKSSSDGFRVEGILCPSSFRQSQIMAEVYKEANVHPNQVKYFECHGTGTKVGDPQELNAISETFCHGRDDPLLIGSVKSNMGHSEYTSAIASLAKIIISMETGIIPGNLHFKEPNPSVPSLLDGRLKVVDKNTPLPPGHIAINAFGCGGSNSHALLKPYTNERTEIQPAFELTCPKMICFSGRTQEAVEIMMKFIESKPDDHYVHALIADHANLPLNLCLYRGYTVLRNGHEPTHEIMKVPLQKKRPVWFIYSGMGSQWPGMGRDLMCIDVFRKIIQKCSDALKPFGVNVIDMIMNGNDETIKSTLNCFTCICAIQIAFTETLKLIGVEPDGIVGHSTGEIVSGYADGCTDLEETMLIAYYRGKAIQESEMPPGAMAAIGLSAEETTRCLPNGVWVACNNAPDAVTVSGDENAVLQFVDDLKKRSVFAKHINTAGVAFHSPHLQLAAPAMLKWIKKVIKMPKLRSQRWISTSVTEDKWDTDLAKHGSAEYHVNNFTSPVYFFEAMRKVPENAVVIEIAPHTLLNAILRRVLPSSCSTFGLMKNGHNNNLEFFFQNLGKIHGSGVTLNVENLYPKISFPVPRGTPMISPLIRWDHSQNWDVVKLEDIISHGSSGSGISFSFVIDPFAKDSKDAYLLDYMIDGRALFPFAGYLVLAWRSVAKSRGLDYENVPIQFENVHVTRATLLSGPTKFHVYVSSANGDFEITENDSICATGRVKMIEPTSAPFFYDKLTEQAVIRDKESENIELSHDDIYKELRLRGYEYGPHFCGLTKMSNTGSRVTLAWTGNWITYLECLLQANLMAEKTDALRLPVSLRYLKIDPEKHRKSILKNDDVHAVQALFHDFTRGCIAGGVEMQDLSTQIIQRRLHASGNCTLERVYFSPFKTVVVKDENALAFKETEHACIDTLIKGNLSSLQWIESPNQFWQDANNTNLCHIYYASLNFRDMMLASSRLSTDAIPGNVTDHDCLLGMEFSGRLSSNGRRVMGLLLGQAMATTAVINPNFVWDVPDHWSMEEAASVPLVYATCYYALILRGRLRKGDKVLIHSGSGGIGLAGICIALASGAEVFTTVSSEEKKRFVQQKFPQMMDRHFSNSRTTEFEYHIMNETNGKGVDVVLNSLSDDKLQASIRCLAKNGRFLEIGEIDFFNNTNLGMSVFSKNITFHGILLDRLLCGDDEDWAEVNRLFKNGLDTGVVKPLPTTVFPSEKAEQAFRFMMQGSHKGKILLKVRDEEPQKVVLPKPMKVRAVSKALCHPQHSYLITGGVEGFGLELAQWLINRGAKKIVLTSRNGIQSGYQARCLLHWQRSGVEVVVSKYNVGDELQTQRLITQCQELGPSGGVFHLAMFLSNASFENQMVNHLKEMAEAKYSKTRNLDKYTRQMCGPELKWFAVWSSNHACSDSNSGQINYDSAIERLIKKRHADGLAGLAVRWGSIGDTGATDNKCDTSAQRIQSCLQVLDSMLSLNHPVVNCYVKMEAQISKDNSSQNHVLQAIARILGVQDVTNLDANTSFGDLGLDSLMSVEIKQALERDCNVIMSINQIRSVNITKVIELAKMAEAERDARMTG